MPSPPRRTLPLVLVVGLVGAFLAGRLLREQAGLEVSSESIQTWVNSLGWRGPMIYIGLMTFRPFLLLPSMIVLSAGGLLFGVFLGTVLGGIAIVFSATFMFGVARGIGREWLRPGWRARLEKLEHRVERAGPLLVGLATAHPMGPMTAFHWAAGFSTVRLVDFVAAVLLSGPVRAFSYAFLGSTLLEPGSSQFYLAASILVGLTLLPLVHPGIRRWVLGPREDL